MLVIFLPRFLSQTMTIVFSVTKEEYKAAGVGKGAEV